MLISEIFGRSILDTSPAAAKIRELRHCPFRGSDLHEMEQERSLVFAHYPMASKQLQFALCVFLKTTACSVTLQKLRLTRAASSPCFLKFASSGYQTGSGKRDAKIGKVDFLLGHVEAGRIRNFAALEVQASYFSGEAIRPAMNHFLKYGALDEAISDRRPDFRSSAQKRLVPQLQLKVPIFRRWGKKFFVVVDTQFFNSLPVFKN